MKFVSKLLQILIFIALIIIVDGRISNAQSAQWRGPDRNGKFPDTNLLKKWPEYGPEKLFVVEGLGNGIPRRWPQKT